MSKKDKVLYELALQKYEKFYDEIINNSVKTVRKELDSIKDPIARKAFKKVFDLDCDCGRQNKMEEEEKIKYENCDGQLEPFIDPALQMCNICGYFKIVLNEENRAMCVCTKR